MKRFIVTLSALFCLSLAQDITGAWNLTGVDVLYYNFARPNTWVDDQGNPDVSVGENGATILYVHSRYPGLEASIPLQSIPAGYMFLSTPNGPFGTGGLAFNGVKLNVTLLDDDPATEDIDETGTGYIPEGSSYPNIDLAEGSCRTVPSIDSVTDDILYATDSEYGLATLPLVDIAGRDSRNRYKGETMGSMSLSQSVIFSYFPVGSQSKHVEMDVPLYDSVGPMTQTTPNENGKFETLGKTGGFIKNADFIGSIGDDGPLTGGDNIDPEFALYWHSIDGVDAETGFGDILPGTEGPNGESSDEDGDGTEFDRIFGFPAITATRISAAGAAALGYCDDEDGVAETNCSEVKYLVAGDVSDGLNDLVYDGCISLTTAEVEGQCNQVVAGGQAQAQAGCEALADADFTGSGGLFLVLYSGCLGDCFDPTGANDTCSEAEQGICAGQAQGGVALYGDCAGWAADYVSPLNGAALTVEYIATQVLQGQADDALGAEGSDIATYVNGACLQVANDNELDQLSAAAAFTQELCAGAGFDASACGMDDDDPDTEDVNEQGLANLVIVENGVTDCASLAAATTTILANVGALVDSTDEDEDGSNCDEWALSVADDFAALSAATGNLTCTALAAGTVLNTVEEVTTSDDQTESNMLYVLNPDPAYAPWGNFVTFNGYASQQVGQSLADAIANGAPAEALAPLQNALDLLSANDSNRDFDPTTVTLLDLDGDSVPETAYSPTGGRLVLEFEPTCVPVWEAVEVQTEFVGTELCPPESNGDLNIDGTVNVSDVVLTVAYILGTSDAYSDAAAECRVDLNGNDSVEVGDIVRIVNIILGVNSSDRPASSSIDFHRTDAGFKVAQKDVLGAAQITLTHGEDFSIELTESMASEVITEGTTTKLIVVAPESDILFKTTGEYVVEEIVAANLRGDLIDAEMPTSFNLSDAYPNPFNPSTSIDIELNYETSVSISVYNVMGQMVDMLYEGNMSAGMNPVTWNASNMASGMYILKANVGGEIVNKKIMLIK